MESKIETLKRAIRRLAPRPYYRQACNDAMEWLAMAETETDPAIAAEYVTIAQAAIVAVAPRGLPSWMLIHHPVLARDAFRS